MRGLAAALSLVCLLFSADAAMADRRVALVIGNGAYAKVAQLPASTADARAMAAKLRSAGFDVIEGIDLTREVMNRDLRLFGAKAKGADIALLYFAGYGIASNSENYLLPVDANPKSEADLANNAIPAGRAIGEPMAPAKSRLVFIDADRGNPFGWNNQGKTGAPIPDVPTKPVDRTLLMVAVSPANSNANQAGSPFTRPLLTNLMNADFRTAVQLTMLQMSVKASSRQTLAVSDGLQAQINFKPDSRTQRTADREQDSGRPPSPVAGISDGASQPQPSKPPAKDPNAAPPHVVKTVPVTADPAPADEPPRKGLSKDDILAALDRAKPPQREVPKVVPQGPAGAVDTGWMPDFPWPPPTASASYVLPDNLLQGSRVMADAISKILAALEQTGYVERSFFKTPPGGVALATRLERIKPDGTSFDTDNRWAVGAPASTSTEDLMKFLRGLFFVDPGYYRLIVFIFGDTPFVQSTEKMAEPEARGLIAQGANMLPEETAQRPFAGYHCTVLVYEFASEGKGAHLVESRLTGKQHLDKAGVLSYLAGGK
jgi:hypothetical protein